MVLTFCLLYSLAFYVTGAAWQLRTMLIHFGVFEIASLRPVVSC